MKPEAQRIAIAEACGYKPIGKSEVTGNFVWWVPNSIIKTSTLPDYLNDLNAMHEAEKVLTFEQWTTYVDFIIDNLSDNSNEPYRGYEVCHATAAQRAEAFLKCLGLWKD